MLQTKSKVTRKWSVVALMALIALALVACGGGGGNPGSTSGNTGNGGSGTGNNGTATSPNITLALVDSANAPVTTLTGSQVGTLRATVKNSAGAGVANAVVNFTSSAQELVAFTPATGSALTNAQGVAEITVKPASFAAAGAMTITVTSTVETKTVTAQVNMAVAAAPVSEPSVTLTLVDVNNASVNNLSGGQSGILRAVVKGNDGKPAANAVVTFVPTAPTLVTLSPESGAALTDAAGVATLTVKPASFTSAGALTINATTVVNSKTATTQVNMAVGAAPLTVGALSLSPAPSTALPAFSTIQLNIPVTSGGQAASNVTGLVMNSLCVGDGTATLVKGSLANGIQTATYTNTGCLRGTDRVTVSIGDSSQSINLAVSPADIGTVKFVGSNLSGTSIVLKGSGGVGRAEAAQLTFKVVDQHNVGLAGVDVTFKATTTTGGLTVTPAKGTTDASGNVTTTVSSGSIPTPVRVIAEATRGGISISGMSDTLTVSTGLPIQRFMSLSASSLNIEGLSYDNTKSRVTALLADQYGNPVSDGVVVNFVTEGGAIASSLQGACVTVNGECSVDLRSQDFRPVNGRVTIMAYAQGLEDFVDANGDGQYSCTNYRDSNGNVPSVYRPLIDTCVSGGEPFTDMGDAFLDAGDLAPTSGARNGNTFDGVYDFRNGDLPVPYNRSTYSAVGDGKWGINYIRRSMELTFSGSTARLVRQVCGETCRDWTSEDGDPSIIQGVAGPSCLARTLAFRLYDSNNNPLPSDTVISIVDTDKIAGLSVSGSPLPSTNAIGGTIHFVTIRPDTTCAPGSFSVQALTPKGVRTIHPFRSNTP